MLGAQARAAEYNAAKNASARQASREAEEQKLPPKPTPLSLGSFARTAALNRNKGTKKYAPLILEQAEEDQDAVHDDETASNTPTKSSRDNIHGSVDPEIPGSGDRIRVRMPTAVPTAPRAMRPDANPLQTGTPNRMGNPPLVMPAAHYGSTPHASYGGAYPYYELARLRGLPFYANLGHIAGGISEGIRSYGNIMVPTDITPTKQEQKLSSMSQFYTNPQTGMIEQVFPPIEYAFPLYPAPYRYIDSQSMGLSQGWDFAQQQPIVNNSVFQRPALQHVQSDITPLTTTTQPPTPAKLLMRHQSSTDEYAPYITPSRASLRQSSNDNSASKSKENEEPYNRNSKIQLFVAAQQAFARTGKTVLNNPEQRKSQEESTKTEERETKAKEIAQDISTLQIMEKYESAPRTVPKVPPGLPNIAAGFDDFTSGSGSDYPEEEEESVAASAEDARLREAFGVGTDDWFDLKPVCRLDRLKMNAAVKNVESEMHKRYKRPLVLGTDPDYSEELQAWFHAETRERQEARREVKQVAADHVASIRDAKRSLSSVSCDADLQAGLIRGAGSMLASLTEYVHDYTNGTRGNCLNRTKPVPEFAVEQPGGLGANLGDIGFFEDERGGLYNAPTRIARDPRFRPQGRDGGKIKAEDEWAYRQDMHG